MTNDHIGILDSLAKILFSNLFSAGQFFLNGIHQQLTGYFAGSLAAHAVCYSIDLVKNHQIIFIAFTH